MQAQFILFTADHLYHLATCNVHRLYRRLIYSKGIEKPHRLAVLLYFDLNAACTCFSPHSKTFAL